MLQYESDAWMMVSTDSGRSGLVPSSFLKVLTQSPFNRPSFQVRRQINFKHTTSMLAAPHIAWRVTKLAVHVLYHLFWLRRILSLLRQPMHLRESARDPSQVCSS